MYFDAHEVSDLLLFVAVFVWYLLSFVCYFEALFLFWVCHVKCQSRACGYSIQGTLLLLSSSLSLLHVHVQCMIHVSLTLSLSHSLSFSLSVYDVNTKGLLLLFSLRWWAETVSFLYWARHSWLQEAEHSFSPTEGTCTSDCHYHLALVLGEPPIFL